MIEQLNLDGSKSEKIKPGSTWVWNRNARKSKWRDLVSILVFVAAVVGVASWAEFWWFPANRAERICEGFVKEEMRAPSTAVFSNEDYISFAEAGAGDTYLVTGDVDGQNGFGAMIRQNFSCFVKGGSLVMPVAFREGSLAKFHHQQ
jgi:hypothetical protein